MVDHRDGIYIYYAREIEVTRTIKTDGRGSSVGDKVIIGQATCHTGGHRGPYDAVNDKSHWVKETKELMVIAFPNDIHHCGMTEDQMLNFGKECIAMVKGARAHRARVEAYMRPERIAERMAAREKERSERARLTSPPPVPTSAASHTP